VACPPSPQVARQQHCPLERRGRKVEGRQSSVAIPLGRSVDYPHKAERATVSGQLVLDDPQAASKLSPISTSASPTPTSRAPKAGTPCSQKRADRHLAARRQLLSVLDRRRRRRPLHHPNVRPGTYTLTPLPMESSANLPKRYHRRSRQENRPRQNHWQPVRYASRSGIIAIPIARATILKGDADNYWLWAGVCATRPLPTNHLHHWQSDYHKDWFFQEVPHSTTAAGSIPRQGSLQPAVRLGCHPTQQGRFVAAVGAGPRYHLDREVQHAQSLAGTAILRVSLAGADGGGNRTLGGAANVAFGGGGNRAPGAEAQRPAGGAAQPM